MVETSLLFKFVLIVLFVRFIDISTASPQWGTYRPHTLISARAPVPNSPFFGFIYHPANSLDIRHIVADAKNQIHSFTWTRHDGSQFGDQLIRDHDANLLITTSFVTHPRYPACTIRMSAVPLDPDRPVSVASLILYAAVAPDEMTDDFANVGSIKFATATPNSPNHHVRINGSSQATGGLFTIRINPPAFGSVDSQSFDFRHQSIPLSSQGTGSRSCLRERSQRPAMIPDEITHFRLSSDKPDPHQSWAVDSIARRKLSSKVDVSRATSSLRLLDSKVLTDPSVLFVQRLLQTPFQIEATLVVSEALTASQIRDVESELSGSNLDRRLNSLRNSFDRKFDKVFGLNDLGFSSTAIDFAKQALSNVLGGIGFFYGSSLVQGEKSSSKTPSILPAIGLLTATPSRDVFPRGFLWDEGFHQLIVQRWDAGLSVRCLQSWLQASQPNGWIPREQILGVEARERFPAHVRHLIVQVPSVANPPTILMPIPMLWRFMKQQNEPGANENSHWHEIIGDLLSKTEQYYQWLKSSQSGKLPNSFRWRGRSVDIKSPEGYPLTLSSGLDDYPRSPTVSDDERHVDLHSWVAWAARAMAQACELDGRNASAYWEDFQTLKISLPEYHAADVEGSQNREDLLLCDYDGNKRACHEGYITILPLLLGLLDASDTRVGAILDALEDKSLLRTTAGVRSLSKLDEWHRKGDDYWTGSVWMPFNFLTLAALKTKYGAEPGVYQKRALEIYKSLRQTILENTMRVFEETGQFWENYSSEEDGEGKSGRQFTGWTSLVLLIMAEMFDGVTYLTRS